MTWNRNISTTEQLMVDVLNKATQDLTLDEIVNEILKLKPSALKGKTPKNSLYSVIYRREKRRVELGIDKIFITFVRGGATYYSLNSNNLGSIGKRIKKT